MEKAGLAEFNVKIVESCLVPPCLPSPRATLDLSSLDNQPMTRAVFNTLLVYEASETVLADPAKTIREALSKVLVYYYPLAGRLRKKEDGKLQVECTGEGVLFVKAMVDNTLSVLGDLDYLQPSFKQLLFRFPSNTAIEEVYPLVLQVNHFTCGGYVVAVTFYHSICDGRGGGQFLKGLGEMARGNVKPSIEPIWNREILKPRNPLVHDLELIEKKRESTSHSWTAPKYEEPMQMSLILDIETIQCMKQGIMKECVDICTTFEIVTGLVWKARIKELEISHGEITNIFFAIDVRGSCNPPLPNGYYGNSITLMCAQATVHEVVSQPLSYIVNIIKKEKMSLTNKHLRSIIDMNQFPSNILCNKANILVSDWRWLGFNEVDFGSGSPANVCAMRSNENTLSTTNAFIFLHPSKRQGDGFKMIMWMHPHGFKSFKSEVESIINKYVTNY